jgi:protein TonB
VRTFDASKLFAPKTIPKQIAMIKDLPSAPQIGVPGGVPGGVAGGVANGVIGGILKAVPEAVPAPPPPPPVAAAPPRAPAPAAPIRVGGTVEAALLIGGPQPQYPILAKEARIHGDVHLEAVIGKDGTIRDLHAVSGNVMLANAAMEAVKHWTYHPTILNGKAVEVATEIVVHFSLT